MATLIHRFLSWMKSKPPKDVTYSLYGDSNDIDFNPKTELLKEARRSLQTTGKISSDMTSSLVFAFFDIRLPGSRYHRLKRTSESLLFFEIEHVNLTLKNNGDSLDDVTLTFKDTSMFTSLRMTVSVKDYEELFETVDFDIERLKRD